MKEHADQLEVKDMCRAFGVSRSGYYAWRRRPHTQRQQQDRALMPQVRQAFDEGRGTYGTRRIGAVLAEMHIRIGRRRTRRLMDAQGLYPRTAKAFRHALTRKNATLRQQTPDLVQRNFSAEAPNRVWTGDITQVDTLEGPLYLAIIEDVFSRYIVGWTMLPRQTAALVLIAFRMACAQRHPPQECVFHSDKGTQYDCHEFRQVLQEHGFRQSMGSTADCFDNAVTESAISTIKSDFLFGKVLGTQQVARTGLFDYIETFYNRVRRHSALGYLSPEQFERQWRGG
jgi:putative transposase